MTPTPDPIAAIEQIEKAMKHATPGKWGQFHPSFMPEANGTPFSSWDSSHGVSAVADGKHVKRLATFTHADDASYLDAVQPLVMAGILAAARQAEEMKLEIAELRATRSSNLDAAGTLHDALLAERAASAELRAALEMISAEAKESNEPIGRSVFKALAACGEIADVALRARSLTKGESDAQG